MQIGELVEIHYPDGVTEPGVIAAFDEHTVTVRRTGADDGAFIVPVRRLRADAPGRWRLDL
jgi:hypothetical protein